MSAKTHNPYLRTRVMTATPLELRLMLFDGAIRFLEQAKAGLEVEDYEASYNGISRCQAIIMELLNTLEPEQAPELCAKLSALYTFMYTRLVKACTERDVKICDEVLELLSYERETWVMLRDELARANAAGAEAAAELIDETANALDKDLEAAQAKSKPKNEQTKHLVGARVSVQG